MMEDESGQGLVDLPALLADVAAAVERLRALVPEGMVDV